MSHGRHRPRGAQLRTAARRIAYGKFANGGQICVAPDYLLLPEEEMETFVTLFREEVDKLYPNIGSNVDYTWIINDHHFARLSALVKDAAAKGARVIEIGTKSASMHTQSRLFLPTIILDVSDAMKVMQDEIFGPILPIVPYRELDEAIAYVNKRPSPLALYVFSSHGEVSRHVIERTVSGNVVINDTIFHFAQDDLPFGGVGMSGMGAYHGPEGFKSMSHAKGVYEQPRINVAEGVRPPFGRFFEFLSFFMLH